jgi:hypothetical protein
LTVLCIKSALKDAADQPETATCSVVNAVPNRNADEPADAYAKEDATKDRDEGTQEDACAVTCATAESVGVHNANEDTSEAVNTAAAMNDVVNAVVNASSEVASDGVNVVAGVLAVDAEACYNFGTCALPDDTATASADSISAAATSGCSRNVDFVSESGAIAEAPVSAPAQGDDAFRQDSPVSHDRAYVAVSLRDLDNRQPVDNHQNSDVAEAGKENSCAASLPSMLRRVYCLLGFFEPRLALHLEGTHFPTIFAVLSFMNQSILAMEITPELYAVPWLSTLFASLYTPVDSGVALIVKFWVLIGFYWCFDLM